MMMTYLHFSQWQLASGYILALLVELPVELVLFVLGPTLDMPFPLMTLEKLKGAAAT